jgi:hypothetical protein
MKKLILFLFTAALSLTGLSQSKISTGNLNIPTAITGTYGNLRVVGYGSRVPFQLATFSDGTATTETVRSHYIAIGQISDIHIAFCNFPGQQALLTDVNPSADVTLQIAIEYPSGTFTNVYFNGAGTYLLKLRATVLSDAVPVVIPDGADFWVRTNVLVTSGQKWVRNGVANTSFNEGIAANTNSYNSGTIANSTGFCFTPAAVLGTSTTNKGSVLWLGDSISLGQNDSGAGTTTNCPFVQSGGIFNRAFGKTYPVLMSNVSGQKVNFYNPTLTAGSVANFSSIFSTCQYAISNLGVNDFTSFTALQVEQSYLNMFGPLKSRGVTSYQCTITPRTSSTDLWVTTTNQTVTPQEAVRIAINTWLRDGAPYDYATFTPVASGTAVGGTVIRIGSPNHVLAGIIEIADAVETSRNSGIWPANGTTDGLHGVNATYTAMAAVLTAVLAKYFNKF